MIADILITVRRHLKVALLVAVIAGLLAGVAGLVLARDVYQSSVTIQLKLVGEAQSSKTEYNQATELLATAQTLMTSPLVLGPAAEKLEPRVTQTDLARRVRFSLPSSSLLMILTSRGRSPEKTSETVEAISESFQEQLRKTPISSPDGRLKLEFSSSETRTELDEPAAGLLRTLASAILAGILMGVAYLLARVLLDNKVRTPHRIASVTDFSVVAITPSLPSSEAIAQLAGNLGFVLSPSLGHRVLAVADTGLHTTSAEVVQSLAEHLRGLGSSTAMVDADLRARSLGKEEQGLSLHLSHGTVPDQSSSQLLAGPLAPNPVELLSRRGFAQIIASYRESHDWTLVNCPPVLPVSDTAIISRHFDGLLLLVDAEHDTKNQLAEALAMLEAAQANVVGLVLVNASPSAPRSPYESGAAGHVSTS